MEGKTTALEEWGDLTKNNTWGGAGTDNTAKGRDDTLIPTHQFQLATVNLENFLDK